jgi:geranylgeranyl diphosphate synthase type I
LDSDGLPEASRWPLSRALANYAETTVRGQSAELDLLRGQRLDIDHYNEAVAGKTAALFALPVSGALIIAGRATDAVRLSAPFAELGMLFQLQDDVVDLYGDKGRGERGADIREGKVSALVVEHLERAPRDRSRLVDILSRSRERTSSEDVVWAALRFEESGALDAVLQRIHGIAAQARAELSAEPALLAVAEELIARSLAPLAFLPGRAHHPTQRHASPSACVAQAV